ncbi:MAG: protein-glutamate methylesterase/protein-glutamine glutaminase [Gammaproteobacteria bacterium]
MKKIKVLIVDDSALQRRLLTEILSADPSIEVVGEANEPLAARELIKGCNPDVLTLDVKMPKMDGLSFLKNLMRLRPMPVVMVSALTEEGAVVTLQALELGAVDFISKPKDIRHTFEDYAGQIISKVKMASQARVQVRSGHSARVVKGQASPRGGAPQRSSAEGCKSTRCVIAIGASTGGTEAIKEVLTRLPASCPGILITQHIPEAFSKSFAARMNGLAAITVSEAKDGEAILPGHAYIAPGNCHLLVVRDGTRYRCKLSDASPVNRHRPSVDVLFRSMTQHVGRRALGVILTGMGADGAKGMKEMHDVGAYTIAQDEQTSVIWGMPGEAVKAQGVNCVLPLTKIPAKILALCQPD